MTDIGEEEPQSPPIAPPPVDNDSPPTAPTSTWSNLQEEGGAGGGEKNVETGRARSPPPLSRKRSRDTLEEDEEHSITVRQEADSTVNFEPLASFDPPPPLFQVVNETPSKKSRECVSDADDRRGREGGEGEGGEGGGEKMEENETESVLSSSTELMETAATEAGEGKEEEEKKEQSSKTSEPPADRSSQEEAAPGNQGILLLYLPHFDREFLSLQQTFSWDGVLILVGWHLNGMLCATHRFRQLFTQ